MDPTRRLITKIERDVQRFVRLSMKEDGLSLTDYEFLHIIRHNPGISQDAVSREMDQDKSAVARRAASMEKRGYILRRVDEKDARRKCLYTTEKTRSLKYNKTSTEAFFYSWLVRDMDERQLRTMVDALTQLHLKCKEERADGFAHLLEEDRIRRMGDEDEEKDSD